MSTLRATNLKGGSAGSAPNLPDGAVATGVITATSFSGSGANLTGIDATALKDDGGTVRVQANTGGAVVTGVLTAPTVIVSGVGSFGGNVSVGGTLTYEDVTNVDSVGLITARNGVKVLAGGINAVGVVTATSFEGSGANLTNLPPSGNQFTAVANGTIAAGKPVVVESDGKVAQVAESLLPTIPYSALGDQTNSSIYGHISVAYHKGLDKYAIIGAAGDAYWQTATNAGNNTYVSFGTRHVLMSFTLSGCMACYDENNERVVFVWWASQLSASTALKAATHGPNLSNATDFATSTTLGYAARPIAAVYYSQVNVCCFMVQQNDNNMGKLYMLDTTTSSTPSNNVVNNRAQINLEATEFGGLATNGTVIVAAYKGSNVGVTYKIITGTNATTYTETSAVTFNDGNVEEIDITYDSNAGKFVLVYKLASNNRLRAVVGTLSGTGSGATISWGTPVEMSTEANSNAMSCEYDPSRKETLVFYTVNQTGYVRYISISGTTPTWRAANGTIDGSTYPGTAKGNHFPIAHNPDTHQMLLGWTDGASNSGDSHWELVTSASISTNANCNNIVGFSDAAYTNGQTATVKTVGNIIDNQSGLTPGDGYYIQGDGTLGTSWDSSHFSSCATNANFGGTAIAADKLLIRDPNAKF